LDYLPGVIALLAAPVIEVSILCFYLAPAITSGSDEGFLLMLFKFTLLKYTLIAYPDLLWLLGLLAILIGRFT